MELKSSTNELYEVQTENRHLKDTIRALREELEKERYNCENRVQKAVASANDEIVQLKSIIQALRDGLEQQKIEFKDKIQNIEQTTQDEKNRCVR